MEICEDKVLCHYHPGKHMDKLKGQLQEVQSEIADILASLAKEKASASGGGAPQDIPAATADSVRSFFGFLAPRVAGHPEGKERIASVMRLLGELLAASRQAEGGAPAAEDGVNWILPVTIMHAELGMAGVYRAGGAASLILPDCT